VAVCVRRRGSDVPSGAADDLLAECPDRLRGEYRRQRPVLLPGLTHQKAIADHQDPAGANARSVLFELQADCFAGVWMHSIYRRGELTRADLRQALDAAAVVADDFQRNAAGERRPREEWTHGSSAQRQQWLTTGFEEGRPDACDTFNQ
jgi:uncharacterized protein